MPRRVKWSWFRRWVSTIARGFKLTLDGRYLTLSLLQCRGTPLLGIVVLFPFRKNLALGRFLDLDSPLHRLDPRTKLFGFAALLVVLFASSPRAEFLSILLLLLGCSIAKVPTRLLFASLRSLTWIFVITVLYHTLWAGPRSPGGWTAGAEEGLRAAFRLVGMMLAVTLLMATTDPLQLAEGLGRLASPLERIGVPVRDWTLVLTLAMRFLPTVMEEGERIVAAQRARGAKFEGSFLQRARSMIPLSVPLLTSCLRRADTLALAMTARGYRPGAPRTALVPLAFAASDTLAIAGIVVYLVIGLRVLQAGN